MITFDAFKTIPQRQIKKFPKLKKEFLNVSIYLNLNDCTIKLFIIIKLTAGLHEIIGPKLRKGFDYVFQFSNLTEFIQ